MGNTTREIPPEELGHFFLAKMGVNWDSIAGDYVVDELDSETIRQFASIAGRRLPYLRANESIESILTKLELIKDGKLTRGAVLLFGRSPQRHFPGAEIHMGRFKDPITIVDDKLLTGNLFQQLEQAMQLLRQYLQVRYEIPGAPAGKTMVESLQREEVWDYPLEALREAVINTLIHRDYFSGGGIQIRVYDDRVSITNPGGLAEGLALEELRQEEHRSIPRNPLLAQVFYYAELVEKWGTGTTRMIRLCREQGLPEPEFQVNQSGFQVRLSKDPYTEERLRQLNLNERQIKAVLWAKEKGSLTNKEYQELSGASRRTATRDLADLVERGLLEQAGRTKGSAYRLKRATIAPIAP